MKVVYDCVKAIYDCVKAVYEGDMRMDKGKLKGLKEKAHALEPVVRIGKNGLTDSTVEQVRRVLAARGLIKVKFLRSFMEENDRKAAAQELAKSTGSQLIDQVGFIAVLYRPGAAPAKSMGQRPQKSMPKRSQHRR